MNRDFSKNSSKKMSLLIGKQTKVKVLRKCCVQPQLSVWNQITLMMVCLVALATLIVIYVVVDDFSTIKVSWHTDSKNSYRIKMSLGREITYEEMFQDIAGQYDLNWRMLASQVYRESSFDPLAVGKDNDTGLMQIIPSTWDEWAPEIGVSDPFDPYSNVLVGAAYMAFLREYFGEMGYADDHWILVAYNWGPNNLRQLLENGGEWGQIPEKRRQYALDILHSASELPPGWEKIRHQSVIDASP